MGKKLEVEELQNKEHEATMKKKIGQEVPVPPVRGNIKCQIIASIFQIMKLTTLHVTHFLFCNKDCDHLIH